MAESSGRRSPSKRSRSQTADEPDRRTEILAVALDLFAKRGYEGTTLREIADAMGFTVAAIYYHFKAKDELLALLADPYVDAFEALVSSAEAGPSLDARRARAILNSYLDLLLANIKLTDFLEQDLAVRSQRQGVRLDTLTERLRTALTGTGAQPSDHVRASACLGALRRPVLRLAHLELETYRHQLVDQAMRVLYPRAGRRTSPRLDS